MPVVAVEFDGVPAEIEAVPAGTGFVRLYHPLIVVEGVAGPQASLRFCDGREGGSRGGARAGHEAEPQQPYQRHYPLYVSDSGLHLHPIPSRGKSAHPQIGNWQGANPARQS